MSIPQLQDIDILKILMSPHVGSSLIQAVCIGVLITLIIKISIDNMQLLKNLIEEDGKDNEREESEKDKL